MRKLLTELCHPKQWKTIASKDLLSQGYPVYGANGLIGYWRDYNHNSDVLTIGCRGTCGALNIIGGKSYINGNAMCLDELSHDIYIRYLYYYLRWYDLRKIITGTTIPQITIQGLQKVWVDYPSIKKQSEIVYVLDKVNLIIDYYQQQLQKLDDLVKARFVEMFGTLDNPARQFEYFTLKELCSKITDGKHGGCIQESGTQRYFVGAREIYDDEVHYDTAPEISIADFEKDYKRCNLEIGDFLIVNTGATIGKSAIASDYRTEKTLLQKSVALLKVKRELLDPVFLQWCYRVNANMYMVESASAQPNLLLSKINSTKIYVPEIELQSQFSSFVEQVDKSKFVESIHVLKLIKEAIAKEVSHDRIR